MTRFTKEDFPDLDSKSFDDIMATGYGPSGEPGTTEHATNVADALDVVNDMNIYVDYELDAEQTGYAAGAAMHANICSLQSAASYAKSVMKALAENPDLLAQVHDAIAAEAADTPKI